MSLRPPIAVQTVTVITRTRVGEDVLGNDVYEDTETVVTGCSVQPLGSEEQLGDRDTVMSRWQLWAPADIPLTATSRVRHDGHVFEIDGEPQTWPGVDGRPHHVTAILKTWTG